MASDQFTNVTGTQLSTHTAGGITWGALNEATAQGEIDTNMAGGGAGFNVRARATNLSGDYASIVFKAGTYGEDSKAIHIRGSAGAAGYALRVIEVTGDTITFMALQKDDGYVTGFSPNVSRLVDHTFAISATTVTGGHVELRGWMDGNPIIWNDSLSGNEEPDGVFTDVAGDTPVLTGNPGFSYLFGTGFTAASSRFDSFTDEIPSESMAAAANVVAAASAQLSSQIRLGASAASASSSTAVITTAIRLAAQAISRAASAGTLNSGSLLQANAIGVATAVAALTASVRASAAASATASASGALVDWATVTLAGDLYQGPGGVLDPNFWMDAVPTLGTTIYYDPTHITIYPNGEISSDSNDAAVLIQFWDGAAWALGLLVITPHLVAYAHHSSSAAAQLSTAISLAASASALVTATAAFSTGVGLSADASGVASASGGLTTGIPMSALAEGLSAAVAALTAAIQLQATALDASTATANLNGVISLNAAATTISASIAALTSQIRLGAVASDTAMAAGSISTGIRLGAVAADVVAAAGNLFSAIRLGGSANSVASASSDITTRNPLLAAAIDVATAIATISTGIELRANADAISRASGRLGSSIDLLADARTEARATAVLTDVIETPPVGVYASDPRFVIAKNRWSFFGKKHTPQFSAKDKAEKAVLTFDLSGVLVGDETLDGPIELTIIATSGTDGDARAVFNGYPAYDMTKRRILLPVKAGVRGCYYYIKVAAATSNQQKYLALAGLLPIRG